MLRFTKIINYNTLSRLKKVTKRPFKGRVLILFIVTKNIEPSSKTWTL